MPGTVTLKPLSAKLTRNTEFFGKMDPYCRVKLGKQKLESQVCKNGGKHPHWEDTLVFKRSNEPTCHLELKEKDWLLPDDLIGACDINLNEIEGQQRVLKWYPMAFHNKPVGQILLEISYQPEGGVVKEENKIVIPVPPSNQATTIPTPVQQVLNVLAPQPQPQQFHPQQQNLECHPCTPCHNNYPQRPHHGVQAPYQHHQQPYPQQPYPQGPVEQTGDKYPQLNQPNLYAPPYGEIHQDNNYPQKYPQFDSNAYGYGNPHGGFPSK